MANDVSIIVPADVATRILALAKERECSTGELVREALCRYQEHGQLMAAISSEQDHSDALNDFIMENVDRIIHEARAERRELAEATATKQIPRE
jgi:hypothetical protein